MNQLKYILLLSLILSFVIFGNGIFGDFVFDDVTVVQNRGDLTNPSNFFNLFIAPYNQNMPKTGLYRPLTMASYAINHYIDGTPAGFHVVNIIIHALNSFLVFWLVGYFFKNKFLAFSSFLLFLTHPIHTEAVTSIVGRAELLMFFFGIASIYFFVNKNKTLSATSFFLALLSKESALMVLPVFLYINVVLLDPVRDRGALRALAVSFGMDKKIMDSVKNLLFFSLPIGLYSLLRYKALGIYFFGDVTTTIVENPLKFASFSERIATAFKVLYVYVEKLTWPVHLSADYSFNAIKIISNPFASIESAIGILIFALLIVLIVFYKKVGKEISFGAVLFLFPYLMISNLIKPIGTIMGERLIYLPSLGFAIIAAFILIKVSEYKPPHQPFWCGGKKWGTKTIYGLLAVILIFYGARTVIRNKDWHDSRTLFYATVKESPDSLITRTALAGVHIRADEWDLAREQLKIAASIYEDNSRLQNLLGVVTDHEGNYSLAEERYKKSLELNPDAINSYINLGELYLKQGRLGEAGDSFLKVIDFYSTTEYIIRYSYIQIALNKPDKALDMVNKYFGFGLNDPNLNTLIGTAYFVKNDYRQALIYLKKARESGNKAPEVEEMIRIAEDNS